MGKGKNYTESFKKNVVEQVTLHGLTVQETATKFDISEPAVYLWMRQMRHEDYGDTNTLLREINDLKIELKKVTSERDALKSAAIIMIGND